MNPRLDGIKAMPCAPSLNAACRSEDQTERGLLLRLHQAHADSSVLGVIAAAVAMLLLAPCLATRAGRLVAASFTAATLVIGLGLRELVAMWDDGPVGLIERVQILVVSGWLAGLAPSLPLCPHHHEPSSAAARVMLAHADRRLRTVGYAA